MSKTLFNNFDFMALRKPAVMLSGVLLLVSLISLFTLKLNVGIDFTGGSIIEVGYEQPVELGPIREALEAEGFGDAIVQHFGSASEVLIRLVPDPEKEKAERSSQVINLLQDLRAELGLTYLLISHNLAVVEHIATRVAVMYLGRIVEQTDTGSLFENPRHPYSEALLGSVLTPEPGLGVPDTHLGASYPNPLDMPSGCTFHPRCPKAMPQN